MARLRIIRKNMKHFRENIHISKPFGIAIFSALMLIMALIIGFHHNPYAVYSDELTKKIIAISIIIVAEIAFVLLYDKVTVLPVELWQNRHLIWKLARNDFKKRYAGSYLGAVWAMVQPVVTVIMYYIVFDVIMGAGDQAGARETSIPYVLFLTAGLVPWFFINEAGGLVNQISSVWEGLAQASFMADYSSQKENLAKLGEIVAGLGSQVSQVASAWSETESGLSARG